MSECRCIVRHANTPKERENARKRIRELKAIGDTNGVIIYEASLDNSNCPARRSQEEGRAHRLCIFIDVTAPDLKEAYRRVYRNMAKLDNPGFSWESTDEAYCVDTGDPYSAELLQQYRMEVFKEEQE